MTDMTGNVLEILARHAQRPAGSLQARDALADLDIDSLKFIVFMLEVEQKLERPIFDVENVGDIRTVGDVLGLVEAASTGK